MLNIFLYSLTIFWSTKDFPLIFSTKSFQKKSEENYSYTILSRHFGTFCRILTGRFCGSVLYTSVLPASFKYDTFMVLFKRKGKNTLAFSFEISVVISESEVVFDGSTLFDCFSISHSGVMMNENWVLLFLSPYLF